MTLSRRIAAPFVAALAVGYLVVMVVSGALPVRRQLVAFEAKGVLTAQPERIRRIELGRGPDNVVLLRRGEESWATAGGAELNGEAGKRISAAVRMMHNSGPARVIPPGELEAAAPAAFGLDAPRVIAKLYASSADAVLTVHVGDRNPDGFLQYMRIEGDDRLYLMSRFIGEAWTGALDESLRR